MTPLQWFSTASSEIAQPRASATSCYRTDRTRRQRLESSGDNRSHLRGTSDVLGCHSRSKIINTSMVYREGLGNV